MPAKGLCLNLITSGSNIWNMEGMILITPFKTEFLHFLYYSSTGLHRIRSSNFRSACQPEIHYQPFWKDARRFNSGYDVHKLKNMWCWLQQNTKIYTFGLIVLMGSSKLSNRLIRCILYPSEQSLNWYILSERMLHQIELIVYALNAIKWIEIPTGLYI